MFFHGDKDGRYSVIICDEIDGGDERLRTHDLAKAEAEFTYHVDRTYVTHVVLLDLQANQVLRTWARDPDRTPDSALARSPH